MEKEMAIIKQENIQLIISAAPQAFNENASSRLACNKTGQVILDLINKSGMTDELDQQAARFIEKSRRTVKAMNERRSPVTKLFDDIRKEFTAMENDIDPTKAGTIPYQLQQLRNQYAAKKRAEEEERRRKELERQQMEAARNKLKQDIEDDLLAKLQERINIANNTLSALDNSVTLDNYTEKLEEIQNFSTVLSDEVIAEIKTTVRIPYGITVDEMRKTEATIKERLVSRMKEQYTFEVDGTRLYILDRLPSKKTNLERMAQAADAAEAARIKAEMEERKRREEAAKEAERQRKEEEERQKAELERQKAEMNDLFNQQSIQSAYQPKAKVTKKIQILNPEGVMPVLSMWWAKEGCTLTVEELSKMFKKQIAFCEKIANKEEIFIEHESVEYIDEVKAK